MRRARLSLLDQTIAVYLYRRVSSKDQARKGLSLPTQTREGLAYIQGHAADAWLPTGEFEDVQTGRRHDREGYQQLLATVRAESRKGRRCVVVVVALDRLGRDLEEGARAWKELKALGVEFHAVRNGGLVTEVMFNLYMSLAQEESRKIGERVEGAWRQFEAKGWHKPCPPAWGYATREATAEERGLGSPTTVLVPHEIEAPYLQELWSRYAEGESGQSLARWAASLPDSARGGRTLNQSAIRQILRAPVYIARTGGAHDLAACEEEGDACAVLAQPVGRWARLVDDDTWRRAHDQHRRGTRLARNASGDFPLTGLLRCERCGSRMVGNSVAAGTRTRKNGRTHELAPRRRYLCASRFLGARSGVVCYAVVPAVAVEAPVFGTLREVLDVVNDERLKAKMQAAYDAQKKASADGDPSGRRLAALDKTVADARRKLAKATETFFDEAITREAYDVTSASLQERIETALEEADRLRKRERRSTTATEVSLGVILASVGGWDHALVAGDPAQRRAALADLIEWVRPVNVGRGKYQVNLEMTPTGKALRRTAALLAPSANLVAIEQSGQTAYSLATSHALAGPA